jgi:hypothetical protein
MSQQNASAGTGAGTENGGAMGNLMNQMLQAGKLAFDSRVPMSLKLMLPIAAALYWIWPLDLMPGLPFDDIAVLVVALSLFTKLATDALDKQGSQYGSSYGGQSGTQPGTQTGAGSTGDTNVVDTTWRVVE